MGIFRSERPNQVERPSVLIKAKIINKKGAPIEEQDVWQLLIDTFRKHPELDIFQCEFRPNKDEL